MTILELDQAAARYPHADLSVCDDPRHLEGDDEEAVAVVETKHDLYPVCEVCLARIQEGGLN